MEKCGPVEMRQALEAVETFRKFGIRFVPMPVLNDDDHEKVLKDMQDKLSLIIDDSE